MYFPHISFTVRVKTIGHGQQKHAKSGVISKNCQDDNTINWDVS